MQQLEQKIRQLVPSLQELSFGCEFKIYSNPVEKLAYIQSFTSGYSRVCTIRDNGDVYTVLRSREEIESWEILGHQIQLHHVMYAIELKNKHFELGYTVGMDGTFKKESSYVGIWDITEPLSGQSEEVVKFLNEVLN